MDRIIFTAATFVALFCAVVVGAVLIDLSNAAAIDAPAAYGIAILIAVDGARRIHRRVADRRLAALERV